MTKEVYKALHLAWRNAMSAGDYAKVDKISRDIANFNVTKEQTMKAIDYTTGKTLGQASETLAKASEAAGHEGVVSAYRDGDDVWQPIDASEYDNYKRLGETVAKVYVSP